MNIAVALILGYLAAIGVFYLFITSFPRLFNNTRKIVLILTHIIFLTAGIYNANDYGVIATPIYLWIIMANGIRFGIFYLTFSLISTVFAFSFLIITHPYWSENFLISIALLLSVFLVSFSYLSLVRSLYNANKLLDNNLKEMSYRAQHDSLTLLPNRAYFRDTLLDRIHDEGTTTGSVSLIFMDLDNFKRVNDKFGHQMGDNIIKEAANRILNIIEGKHFTARLGGDEFVVIFNNIEPIKPKVNELIKELAKPYFDKIDFITVSVGISTYIKDDSIDDEEVLFQLQKKADKAMYQAKTNGKNCFYFDIDLAS